MKVRSDRRTIEGTAWYRRDRSRMKQEEDKNLCAKREWLGGA